MCGSFYKQNPWIIFYRGLVRQRGSCVSSIALKIARHALPLLSKYVLPSVKRVGKTFALNLLPKVFDVVTRGREATTSQTLKKQGNSIDTTGYLCSKKGRTTATTTVSWKRFQNQHQSHTKKGRDMQCIGLKLESENGKGADGDTNLETELAGGDTVAEATDKGSFINNTLHSFFSNFDILINKEIVHTSNNLYAQRAFAETVPHTRGCATTKLIWQDSTFEHAIGDMLGHRETWTLASASKTIFGKLAVDFLACDYFLIPNCSMRIRLTRNKPEYLQQIAVANAAFTPKIERVSLFACYYTFAEDYQINLQQSLLKWPARFYFFEVRSETFVIKGPKPFCL